MCNCKDNMVKDLAGLVAIDSVSHPGGSEELPFGEGPKKALDYTLALCEKYGFKTKRCGNFMGYAETGEGEEIMGILCHLDVVPAGDGWNTDPFKAEVIDGKLYGRGVIDDKGPAMAAIYAVKDLMDSGAKFNKRVRILFGETEEVGEWKDMKYYKKNEEKITFGFTPDADFPAIYGEKGIAIFELKMPLEKSGVTHISGGLAHNMVAEKCTATIMGKDGKEIILDKIGKSAHGSMPEEGINAISLLMKEIGKLNNEGKTDCGLAKFYNEVIGMDVHGESMDCDLSDEQSGRITFNVGMIGIEDGFVKITIDARCPVTFGLPDVEGRIRKAVEPYGIGLQVDDFEAPIYMDKNGFVITKLLEAYREITGDMTEPSVIGGGTYARAMDNVIAFGPMFPGRELTEHQANEYIILEDLYKAREIYKLAISKLAIK